MNENNPGRRDAVRRGALLALGAALVLAVPVGAVAATSALNFEDEPGRPIGDAALSAKVVESNDDDGLDAVSGPGPVDDSDDHGGHGDEPGDDHGGHGDEPGDDHDESSGPGDDDSSGHHSGDDDHGDDDSSGHHSGDD